MDRFAGKKIQDFLSFANAPEYDAIGAQEIYDRGEVNANAMRTKAKVAGAAAKGLGKTKEAQFNALGNIEVTKLGAEANEYASAVSDDVTRSNAMSGMFGSFLGAGIGAIGSAGGFGGYSGTGSASSIGSDINPSTGMSFQSSVDDAMANFKFIPTK